MQLITRNVPLAWYCRVANATRAACCFVRHTTKRPHRGLPLVQVTKGHSWCAVWYIMRGEVRCPPTTALSSHSAQLTATRPTRTIHSISKSHPDIDNMLTAVSSWEPHPALATAQDTVSPASSCQSSPTQPIDRWTKDELEAAEALVMLSRSARARQYHYAAQQAGLSCYQAGHTYSQAGISYQLVGPAQPGFQVQPGFYAQPGFHVQPGFHARQGIPFERPEQSNKASASASVAQPVAGPSVVRGSRASSRGSALKSRSASPAPEAVQTPSPSPKASRSPTPASTKPVSAASSIGPQRTPKYKGKARASPMATTDQESKGRKRKAKAKAQPQEQVVYNAKDPREYYISRAEWIGLDLETGEPMAGVPPLKSPATEYQTHILTWIFENITPQPDRFWKAVIAIKLSM